MIVADSFLKQGRNTRQNLKGKNSVDISHSSLVGFYIDGNKHSKRQFPCLSKFMSLLELTLEEQCIRIFLCSCLSIYTKVLSVPQSIETEKSERDQVDHELDERQQKIRRR